MIIQGALIDSIICDVNIGKCDINFNFHSISGKFNYIGQTSHRDILLAIHQIAKYSSDPRKE
ncbi:hypothetical protein ACHAW6_014564 [Cyclotella cf. meneghiniana]